MLFNDAQYYTTFKSNCKLSQSVTSHTPEYSLVSSTNLTSLDADTSLSISYSRIGEGPKRFPVGHHLTQGGLHYLLLLSLFILKLSQHNHRK